MKVLDLAYFICVASAAALPLELAAKAPAPANAIRYLGRVNPANKQLTWPGTGVTFTFTGTTATIGITGVSGTTSVDLIVDGKTTTISNVAGSSIATSKLAQGTHTVELRKRSETYFGTFSIGDITSDGTFATATAPKRKIEIIGDSISVGYGLDGVNPCSNTAPVEDNPKTYGALAAKALGADYSVIAWSGKGLTRNYASNPPDTSPVMPQLWTRYSPNDASDNTYTFPSTAIPDAVVINLGTNDFSYQGVRDPLNANTFTSAMVTFVKNIQAKYPNAHFFLLNSPMLSDSYPTAADAQKTTQTNALKSAITQLGSAKVHFVDWPTQGSDVGCDYHPNAATHAAEGTVLASAIKSALGW